ncbi:protein of unknown function [Aminobacter niigataensis]|nr:protein of unknown function [Aminobacter niigataensis]
MIDPARQSQDLAIDGIPRAGHALFFKGALKPITCVLADDETASWKLVFNMDRRHVYVGTGRPPYRRLSIDEILATGPQDTLQRQAWASSWGAPFGPFATPRTRLRHLPE